MKTEIKESKLRLTKRQQEFVDALNAEGGACANVFTHTDSGDHMLGVKRRVIENLVDKGVIIVRPQGVVELAEQYQDQVW